MGLELRLIDGLVVGYVSYNYILYRVAIWTYTQCIVQYDKISIIRRQNLHQLFRTLACVLAKSAYTSSDGAELAVYRIGKIWVNEVHMFILIIF